MNLSKIAVKRPVTTVILLLIVVLIGFVSIMGLPLDLFPNIEMPVAAVMVQYPNASPEEIENMVTKPIEQQLATVQKLDKLVSMTMAGSSITMVQFDMGTDMNFATLEMREKIALVKGFLPEDATDPIVMKMDLNATPVMQVYVSGDLPLSELYKRVDGDITSSFERVSGVASVSVTGGVEREVAVTFSQERLAGYGLTLAQISQMLAAENVNLPSGSVEKGSSKIIVRTMGEFQSVDDLKQFPITLPTREVIHLQDVASIVEQDAEQSSINRVDGIQAIGIFVTKQSTANTVNVSDNVRKNLEQLRAKNPDLTFTVGLDQSNYIRSSVSSVAASAIQGGLLAILVIFLFLKNISSTLIIGISIPTSFLATFILMKTTGMSLNLITLCGLTLGVGMLVDNSVVVLENIYRLNQTMGNPQEAAIQGSKQVLMAVTASTLTSVVVFLPIALSGGFAGMMFKDFCFTIIFALIASLAVSLTAVPTLCSRLLRKEIHTDYMRIGTHRYRFRLIPYFTRFIDAVTRLYEASIHKALHYRKTVILVCLVLFGTSTLLVAMVGMELLPASDEGTFTITAETPYGSSLEKKDQLMSQLEKYVLTIPELEHSTVDISDTNTMGGSSNKSSISVTLTNKNRRNRSTSQIVKEAKKQFSNIAGAKITVAESTMTSAMTGGSAMTLTLRGEDLSVLERMSNDLLVSLNQVKGVTSFTSDMEEGNPELRVILNRNVAAHFGINSYQLATGLKSALSGSTATKLKMNGDEIKINLSLTDNYHATVDNLKQVMIPSATGQMVPVGQIATLEYDNSPSVINRENQQRTVSLSCTLDNSRDLGSVSKDVLTIMNSYPFPENYSYDTGGQQEQMAEAFHSLLLALIISVLLVYMLLAAQFESFALPFVVMMSIPFAMSGAFLALFLTGKRLSLTAFIGLIMLIGIVVNNAILLIEFIKQNRANMDRNQAVVLAGKTRLRPILMTTITTVVGMIPLSLGMGDGGEILSPMGISIIGGLCASTLVTLILIPVLYTIVDDKSLRHREKKEAREQKIQALEQQWIQADQTAKEKKANPRSKHNRKKG